MTGQMLDVGGGRKTCFTQNPGRLSQREGEITKLHGYVLGIGGGNAGHAAPQQTHRFLRGKNGHSDRRGDLAPVRVS